MAVIFSEMKHYNYIILTLAAIASFILGGCSAENKDPEVNIAVIGEWHLTEWSGEKPEGVDVYLEFLSDGEFNIYQHLESNTYEHLSGTFSTSSDFITGCYDDGEKWNSGYHFVVSADGETLTLTSDTGSGLVSIYTKAKIPAEVRNSPVSRAAAGSSESRIL
ncbi:MAG TPA: hypothetical protein DCY24_01945 [Rikenellaceae bacterium]|nr:hypothetical protein [Rikenellaceae bacterium]